MKTTLLLLAWLATGLTVESAAWAQRHEARTTKLLQQASAEKQQAVERERWVAERNLHQAETFIAMCLDRNLKYAYLGPLVFECKAKQTKHNLKM